jgi:hypothetical protein
MITMTSVEAQNSFGKLLDMAQREAVYFEPREVSGKAACSNWR